MDKEVFNEKYAPVIPKVPGVYRYYNHRKKLLYVGKAKDLKNRISSYFSGEQTLKTEKLVQQIHSMEWTVTPSEHDAFLMENSLIKHFQPPYNISLKDDKTYPYVVIKNEAFPRIFLTRQRIKDGSTYLGPYTNVKHIRTLLELIKKYIPLRSCNLNLSKSSIARNNYRVCLDYHIGKCLGPCEGLQTEEEYMENVELIKKILKGNITVLLRKIESDRDAAAGQLNFERAHYLQQQIEEITAYRTKNSVVSNGFYHLDVISALDASDVMYVSYMMVEEGQVIQSQSIMIEKKLTELPEDVLSHALIFFRQKFKSEATEIVASHELFLNSEELLLTLPKAGPKKQFLDLSEKNAFYFKMQEEKKLNLKYLKNRDQDRMPILTALKDQLELPVLPLNIECFDNSNIQGSSPVSAMVSFKDGLPSKNDYRYFHIKTVKGIDDYATMKEVVHRRYARLLNEDKDLPDLIIIDGGKGQLSAAHSSLENLGIADEVILISIAEREEQIFKWGEGNPIILPYNSDTLLFLRRIRNEVHDYGLRFHRKTRSKNAFKNELEDIPSIGKKTAEDLLKHFKSVAQIKKSALEDIQKVIGKKRGETVYQYFKIKS